MIDDHLPPVDRDDDSRVRNNAITVRITLFFSDVVPLHSSKSIIKSSLIR